MDIELAFRTYNSFGPNATLVLASSWLTERTSGSYGGNIRTVLVEACCRNTSPPKKTLESLHENFDAWIQELPFFEVRARGTELRLCYHAVLYRHAEIRRDTGVLSVKMFGNVIAKTAQTLAAAPNDLEGLRDFRVDALVKDLQALSEDVPRTLDALAELYLSRKGDRGAD